MVNIVNVVGSGSLDIKLDLDLVAEDIGPTAQYDPDKYPGMYLRFAQDAPLITVYRTGKYIVTGADSVSELHDTRDRFLHLFAETNIIRAAEDDWFSIQNLVCTGELDQSLNLTALAVGLGLEDTEYEPEQFPGLIYRPSDASCVLLIFATGKVVITGSPNIEATNSAFKSLKVRVEQLNSVE